MIFLWFTGPVCWFWVWRWPDLSRKLFDKSILTFLGVQWRASYKCLPKGRYKATEAVYVALSQLKSCKSHISTPIYRRKMMPEKEKVRLWFLAFKLNKCKATDNMMTHAISKGRQYTKINSLRHSFCFIEWTGCFLWSSEAPLCSMQDWGCFSKLHVKKESDLVKQKHNHGIW